MNNQEISFNNSKIKEMAKKITMKAKSKNLIKPLSEAFIDVPVEGEIHKGKAKYYGD